MLYVELISELDVFGEDGVPTDTEVLSSMNDVVNYLEQNLPYNKLEDGSSFVLMIRVENNVTSNDGSNLVNSALKHAINIGDGKLYDKTNLINTLEIYDNKYDIIKIVVMIEDTFDDDGYGDLDLSYHSTLCIRNDKSYADYII